MAARVRDRVRRVRVLWVASTNGGGLGESTAPRSSFPLLTPGSPSIRGASRTLTRSLLEAPGYNSVIGVTPDGGRIWWQSFLREQFSPLRPWTARSGFGRERCEAVAVGLRNQDRPHMGP